jgi:hypothetical protein
MFVCVMLISKPQSGIIVATKIMFRNVNSSTDCHVNWPFFGEIRPNCTPFTVCKCGEK